MQNPNHISHFCLPLMPLVCVSLCLGAATVAFSAPTANGRSAAKPIKAPSSAPLNMGNGIYVLGDDSRATTQSAPSRMGRRTATAPKPVTRLPQPNLNPALVQFCRAYLGRKLGNGQCSELAMIGLPAIGARMDLSHQWGTPVCNYGAAGGRQFLQVAAAGKVRGNPRKASVRAGDLIQYENVKFERRWNGGYSVKEYPHHTSVVERVSRDGNTIQVLEQNVNGTQFVVETVLYLPDQTEGSMHITRPLPR